MEGDLEREPSEGVDALDDLAAALEPEGEGEERAAPEEGEESEGEQEGEEGEEADESEDEDEEGDDEADDAKRKFTIKHDGKEIALELTPAEEIAMLQQSFDYSKKTMAVAEERKAVQAEREQAEAHRKQVEATNTEALARLDAYTKYMETQVGQPPSAELLTTHGADVYLAQKEQYEARKGQLQQAYQAAQAIRQEEARQRQASIEQKAASTEKVLRDTLPGWGDDTLKELSDYADTLGLNPKSAEAAMLEPGFWQLAHKAKAFDAIQAKKAQMKPTEKLAKVVKPSAANQSGKAAARAKREAAFHKNPSVDTLADLL
jgi:hypothetical protein